MQLIKNKKVFGLFNLFDILFLIVVLLLLFASYYRYFISDNKELFVSNMNLEYTGYISKVDLKFVDNLNIGDYIYMSTNRENTYLEIGKIVNIELIPYKEIDSNKMEFYDVILTIVEIGNKIDDDYLSGTNVELHVGNIMDVVTQKVYFNMLIQNIQEV